MYMTQHINHVERSLKQGFTPLTYQQFTALARRIQANVPRGWDKV